MEFDKITLIHKTTLMVEFTCPICTNSDVSTRPLNSLSRLSRVSCNHCEHENTFGAWCPTKWKSVEYVEVDVPATVMTNWDKLPLVETNDLMKCPTCNTLTQSSFTSKKYNEGRHVKCRECNTVRAYWFFMGLTDVERRLLTDTNNRQLIRKVKKNKFKKIMSKVNK